MAQEKIKPFERMDALSQMGLTETVIRDAVLEGEFERDSCTAHHPKTMPGFLAYGTTIRSLRDQLVIVGWTCAEDRNYSTVVNPEKTIAIATASGDDGTGRAGFFPNVKSARGAATKNVVHVNQISLFDLIPHVRVPQTRCMTWILLRQRDRDRVYFELSLPARMTDEGYILEWDTRIIFEPEDIDGDLEFLNDSQDSDAEFNIPIVRRAIA